MHSWQLNILRVTTNPQSHSANNSLNCCFVIPGRSHVSSLLINSVVEIAALGGGQNLGTTTTCAFESQSVTHIAFLTHLHAIVSRFSDPWVWQTELQYYLLDPTCQKYTGLLEQNVWTSSRVKFCGKVFSIVQVVECHCWQNYRCQIRHTLVGYSYQSIHRRFERKWRPKSHDMAQWWQCKFLIP